MNDIRIFENPKFGKIRTVDLTADAIRAHVDEEDKGVGELETPGGIQSVVLINESGLYSLILSSKLPEHRRPSSRRLAIQISSSAWRRS